MGLTWIAEVNILQRFSKFSSHKLTDVEKPFSFCVISFTYS